MKRVKLGISGSLVFLTVAIAFVPVTTAAAQGNQPQAIAEKASSLIGTQWMLVKLDGKPIPHGGLQPYFALKGGEQLASGSTGQLVDTSDGCNDLTGFYEIRGDSLNIHVVAATLLTCRTSGRIPVKRENGGPAPAPTYQPRSFLKALSATSRFSICGSTLELLDQSGVVRARFVANNAD